MEGLDGGEDGSWEESPFPPGMGMEGGAPQMLFIKEEPGGGWRAQKCPIALCGKRDGTKGEKHISELQRGMRRATGGKVHPRS